MSYSDSGPCAATAMRCGAPGCQLHRDPAEQRRERDERPQHLEVGLIDDRDVHRVRDDPAVERGDDLLGDDDARPVLRLVGGGRQVRGDDDLVELEQGPGVRLGREHVERRARELPGPNRLDERLLVDERAARRVDEPRAVAHPRDRIAVDEAAGLVGEGRVERHDVRGAEQLVERLDLLDAQVAEPVAPDERVVGDDVHRQPERAPRDLLSDPPEADHAERLPGQLDSAVARALPATLLQGGMRLRDVAGERDDQPDRLLRRRHDRRLGRVRDDDPATCRGVHVHVVDADAGTADDLQARPTLDDVAGQLRRRPDDDGVVAGDDLLERRLEVDVHLEPRAKELDPRVGDRLPDQDAHQPVAATEPKASKAAGAARPGSTSAPASRSSTSIGAQRLRDVVDRDVADVADAEEPRDEVSVAARDRDPVPVAERETQLDRVDPVGRQRAGEHGRAVVVRGVELEPDRLDPRAARPPERPMPGERRVEAVLQDEPESLDERHDGRRRRA